MKILQLKKKTAEFRLFKKGAWAQIHPKHYGVKVDWAYWDPKELILQINDEGKIVGALVGDLMAGVLYIAELIIDQKVRGKGYGKKLLLKAESWAKKNGGHQIYLYTGKDWEAVGFYEKIGYKVATTLPNFYSKIDFVLMYKFL